MKRQDIKTPRLKLPGREFEGSERSSKGWGWLDNPNYRTVATATTKPVPIGPVESGDPIFTVSNESGDSRQRKTQPYEL
ncbi:hypothetical protein [Pontibacter populi]|uniref:Uncharacterized protein n=1 Tax=Pontibacter populi TaxID=890055 RepID=A0ABV1RQY9_9BACT